MNLKLEWNTLKHWFQCLLGKHDWIVMYRGIEGESKDCRYCGKTEETGP